MRLTDREREVVRLLCEGHLFKTVARELGVTESTIERHLENARDRNNAKTTTQVCVMAVKEGLIK